MGSRIEEMLKSERMPAVGCLWASDDTAVRIDDEFRKDLDCYELTVGTKRMGLDEAVLAADGVLTTVWTVFEASCPKLGVSVEVGEGTWEGEAFVMVRDLADGSMRWLMFLRNPGPPSECAVVGESVTFISDGGFRWTIPLAQPEATRTERAWGRRAQE